MTHLLSLGIMAACAALTGACETSTPTRAVLDNGYAPAAAASVTVYKGWWSVASFLDPVPAGAESAPVRIVEGTDYGYALLAPGWIADSGAPSTLVPVRTRTELTARRGDTLHLHIAPDTADGDCASGTPLSQSDADFITARIFPAEFAGKRYDAATCTTTSLGEAGGATGGDSEATGGGANSGAGNESGAGTSNGAGNEGGAGT